MHYKKLIKFGFEAVKMKKVNRFISIIMAICLIICACPAVSIRSDAADNSSVYAINSNDFTGTKIKNIVGYMNTWNHRSLVNAQPDGETDISFVEYIELMTATGGDEERDIIDSNGNMIEQNLIILGDACQGVLNLGAKPLIKFGNVPFYFTMKGNPSKKHDTGFCFNPFPPDDDKYTEYMLYIENITDYLIARFGIDEVRSWRFGVLTEYENDDWFYTGNASQTMTGYCKLYDYTAQALVNKLGRENVYIGAHSMTVTEGAWDERNFIDHIASGYNYATGTNSGVSLSYLASSFYDMKPGEYTSGMTAAQSIDFLRSYAQSKGLNNLAYGFDEGRILAGVNQGSGSGDLATRCVGHTWQAAYDARLYKSMIDADIDYFSMWSWTSSSDIGKGYPTMAYHVAESVYKMVGDDRINAKKTIQYQPSDAEADCIASYNQSKKTMKFLAYNFKNDISYNALNDYYFDITMPELAGKTVMVKRYNLDDSCNYFDEWWQDRNTYGITDDKFAWSPDDPAIDSPTTLSDSDARNLYYTQLRNKYVASSKLTPSVSMVTLDSNGCALLSAENMRGNSAIFYEVSGSDFDISNLTEAYQRAKAVNSSDYENYSALDSLLKKADSFDFSSQQEIDTLTEDINYTISLLIKKHPKGAGVSEVSHSTSYSYAYLFGKIRMLNTNEQNTLIYSTTDDNGSAIYNLEGNDTYDFNGFHVWNRTYQNGSTSTAHYYVDRARYSNLSQLGNIVLADFTTYGRNHQHSIGISNIWATEIDGYNTSISVQSDRGNNYSYSLCSYSTGTPYSSGSTTSFEYTPSGEVITTSNSAAISGPIPQNGETVTFRIGSRTSVIDAAGYNNLFNYFAWTDVSITAYDSTQLRNEMNVDINSRNYYDAESFNNYYSVLSSAVNVLNNSFSQSEIDSYIPALQNAENNLLIAEKYAGDVNLDGFVDARDSVMIQCIIENMLTKSDMPLYQYKAADADRDRSIAEADTFLTVQKGLLYY